MKTLMVLLLLVPSVCLADGFHISAGLGIHDPAYDWHLHTYTEQVGPEVITTYPGDAHQGNPMGLVQMTYKIHRFTFGLVHISSIPNHRDDHGLNMAYVMIDIY